MKKTLLLFALTAFFITGLQDQVTAQVCMPDSAYTQSGIWPDSATGFAPAIQCTYYEQLITAIVPADTATGTVAGTCNIDSVVLDSLVGLPPGLSYACISPTCSFLGGTTDCGIVYGTPTDTGTFPLIVATTAYISGGFLNLCDGQTAVSYITYYYIVVTSPIAFTSSGPCGGSCDGQITASVSGPPSPYNFMWNNAQTTETATGLCSGTYTVTVTDSAGCISTDSVSISAAPAIVAVAGSIDASCSGSNDGVAYVGVSGGVGSYTYLWDDLSTQTTDTAFGLGAGSYSVVVTDSAGCVDSASVVISEPTAITLTMASTDATCGVANGSASVSASGGAGSYAYVWNDPGPQTTDTATALIAGGYSVTVTDTSGCSEVGLVSVNNTGAATVSITAITNVTCNGASDGSAIVLASGGTLPYTYSWDDPGTQTTDTAVGLAGGTYVATVTDGTGCIASDIAVVLEPAALSLSMTSNDVTCSGLCDGDATVTVTGGTAAYAYIWNDTLSQTGSIAVTLCVATYTVIVTDGNGCTDTASIVVSEPGAIIIGSENATDPSCYGAADGGITIVASGGTGSLTYSIDGGMTYAGSGTFTGQGGGTYNVVVMDSAGCIDSGSVLTITDPPVIVIDSVVVMNISCNGLTDASVVIYASGGTGALEYSIDGGTSYTNTSGSFTGLGAITVISAVRDSTMCEVVGNTYTITEPAVLSVNTSATIETGVGNADGTATAVASGGSGTYTYSWNSSPVQTTAIATGLPTGDYVVQTTDSNGCMSTDTVNVGLSIGIESIVHNLAFKLYPNPAYTELNLEVNLSGDLTFMAYDVTGKQVLGQKIGSGKNIVSLADLSTGLYVYRIFATTGVAVAQGKFNVLK